MQQLTHYNSKFKQQTFPIIVICENVSNAPNIGSLFRICDAFGVEKLIFCGEHIPIPSRKMQKTSRATEKHVPFQLVPDIHPIIKELKESHELIALEITQKSIAVQNLKININKPIALIIGDENFGVSEDILAQVNTVTHINMFGQNSSMNVVQATNIALYEITKQLQLN
ncbi:TrmH family RNA methyltransferase [Pseudofulvibacter geojedonensis]|uniref:TrmH family RNA methyltransferase n=1 Tax=Pseudofulvibacter geojedonensis TaxID=1123758 RepID=A0ABW3I2S5_9FLAO